MKNISIILAREYRERVYKKSFIVTTILMPLLMIAFMAAPTLIMAFGGGSDRREITVIDLSGKVAPNLASNDEVLFEVSDEPLQQALARSLEEENFGVLYIGEDIVENPKSVQLYTNASSSVMLEDQIASQIEKVIESERLKAYNIENFEQIMKDVRVDVTLSAFRNDETDPAAQSAVASSLVGMLLGFMLYFFLAIYGSIVMQSIIEEKNSRILEVMVSTVRPFDMMMGKILGVAAVAATQVAVWGVLILVLTSLALPAVMPDDVLAGVQAVQGGADVAALTAQGGMAADLNPEMLSALASVTDTGYLAMIVGSLMLFLVGGFLLYAAMYAAVGASVDEAQDAQQLTIPITAPIIIAFIVLMMIMHDPNSPVVVWCSMIPFTSPIVMVARIPAGIPAWEIALSLVLLYATFGVVVWMAGKIYRVGIFMHGKKPTFKELWRWMRY